MWEEFRERFPIFEEKTYLNTCSLGALSRESRQAVLNFLDQWQSLGASAWYELWLGEIEAYRNGVARLLGCGPHEVALFPNVSAGLAAVASALDYRDRPRVACAELDFPTVPYQWHARIRDGVETRLARSPDGMGVDEVEWRRVIDERTAVVATSHVFFTTGWAQDLQMLRTVSSEAGALLAVDAYQSAGILPLPVKELDLDILITGGLKWLLGGPGIACLYVREGLHERLDPRATGWFAVREPFRFDVAHRDLRDDARRLEGGTPAPAAVFAARAGLDLVLEHGIEALGTRTLELVDRLVAGAAERGMEVRLPEAGGHRSGIVILPDPDPRATVAALATEGFIVDARPTGVRVSPYAYNRPDDIDRLLDAIQGIKAIR